jgi:hydroxyethylthiazole kinase
LAKAHGCAVAVSGAEDFITDGTTDVRLLGGSPLMPRVTGMGCTATAMVGAFAAVSPTPLRAATGGMAAMKVAGELAAGQAEGPGSFVPCFLDALYGLAPELLAQRIRMA